MTDEEYAALSAEYGLEDDEDEIQNKPYSNLNVSKVGGTARAVGQGLTLGFGDELEAFVTSSFTDKTYDEEVDMIRNKLSSFRETNPVLAYGGEVAGSIIPSFTPAGALGKVGQAVSKMGAVKKSATIGGSQGAIYGAGASEGDVLTAEGLKQRAMGAGVGLGLGAGLGAGVSAVLPKTSVAAQELLDLDVPVTIGQAFKGQGPGGKLLSGIEETLTSLPGVGPSIAEARLRGLAQFNKLAILEAAEPALTKAELGVLKKQIANLNGQEAFKEVSAKVGDKYNKLLDDFVLPEQGIYNVLGKFEDILQKEYAGILDPKALKATNALFQKPLNKLIKIQDDAFILEGKNLKLFEGELKDIAKSYKLKGGLDGEIGKVFDEMTRVLKSEVDQFNPGNQLNEINKGWAKLATIKLAVNKASRNKGIFTSEQFLDAIKQADPTKGKTNTAKGQSFLQQFAEKGNDVLAKVTPDSGTASRIVGGEVVRDKARMTQAFIGSLLGEIAYNPYSQIGLRSAISGTSKGLERLVPYTAKQGTGLLDDYKKNLITEKESEEAYIKSLLER